MLKSCPSCRQILELSFDNFYRLSRSKTGFTPRCKTCVNRDNLNSLSKRREKEPEKCKKQASERTMRSYRKDIEKSREKQRLYKQHNPLSPEQRHKKNMAKRAGEAGLTVVEFYNILIAQQGRCAICKTSEPNKHTGSKGWNIDHCHKTNKIRFILCNHCNRGLGAFRDNPIFLRKAAELLERFYNDNLIIPIDPQTL